MSALIIGLILLGLNSYRKLGLENFPKIDSPYVTITTTYFGATPREIETDIAKEIEDAVASIDGIKHVNSMCMEDVCITLIEFQMEVDVDVAAFDVREQIDLIRQDLPADADDPEIEKFDINAKPIIYFALTGDVSVDDLYDYADDVLQDKFSTIRGVAEVELIGGEEREIHVQLDRDLLAAKGLTSADVVGALRQGARKLPSGRVRDHGEEFTVTFDAEVGTVEELGAIQVPTESGTYVYLRDLGRIVVASEEYRQRAFIDGRPAIAMRIVKKSDANAVAVVRRVRAAFDEVDAELPGGMELIWVTDDGNYIQAMVDTGLSTILQGIALTAAILFVFLYDVRSTIIVAVTMPISVIVSLFFLNLMGYTFNMFTLLSLALSVGVLVTMSIVVLESIVSHLGRGEAPADAAAHGTARVTAAVLASAGTNIVVLFPLTMMKSKIGMVMIPFAITMVIVTSVSVFTSFTLTPILCSKLLRTASADRKRTLLGRLEALWNRMFGWVEDRYEGLLRFMERHRVAAALGLLAAVGLLVQSLKVGGTVGFTFVHDTDQAQLYVKLEFPTYYSLDWTTQRTRKVEQQLRGLPDMQHTYVMIGKAEGTIGQSTEGVYLAQILVTFPDKTGRDLTIEGIKPLARDMLANLPDAIVTVNAPSAIGGQASPIELEIYGEELGTLDRLAVAAADETLTVAGTFDVDTTVREGKPEIKIYPDREVLSDLKAWPNNVGTALRGNIEGIEAATYKQGDRSFDIRVKFIEQKGVNQVPAFLFPGDAGRPVPLETIANVKHTRTPVRITRKDKQRISKIYSNLAQEKPLGVAVNEISALIDRDMDMPPGYKYGFGGHYELMQEAGTDFLEAAVVAIVLTYLLLAAILESFTQPFLILITIPLALIGVMYALYLAGESISIFVMLGFVMMIGIVVNNAILIMGEVNNLRADGVPTHAAMIRAARDQLRPIIMITLAAVLGMLPLALSRGLGCENRIGIGVACIGGIAMSGLLTLLVIPIMYDLFTRRPAPANLDHK